MSPTPDRSVRTAVVFTALALGFSVLYWVVVVLTRNGTLHFSMEHSDFARKSVPGTIVWLLFDNFGPALAAIIAVAACRGRAALADLGRSIIQWRVPGRLYLLGWFGLLVNTAVVIAGYATHSLRFDGAAFGAVKFALLYFAMILFDGPLGEEIGWRGVLLPELLRKMQPLAAAIVVGVIWYAWHVPLYAADARLTTPFEQFFFLYTCVALSVLFTWFFLRSNGSTFLMIYLHAASNYSTFLRIKLFPKTVDSRAIGYAYVGMLTVLALIAAAALRKRRSMT